MFHRRELLRLLASSAAGMSLPGPATLHAAEGKRTGLGLVLYCSRYRRQAQRQKEPGQDLYEPMRFLEHCRRLGAGGMQADLGVRDTDYTTQLRRRAEQQEMYIEAILRPPQARADLDRFDAEMQTASRAGALAVRTVIIPGRRYESFSSLDQLQAAVARGRKALELAAPIAEKYRLPLAVENHKDQRTDERLQLFRQIGSAYVGACVDTGNSLALLEDPLTTVEQLAPHVFSVHLKDQAVRETEKGFLLGDIPLGQGIFDLKQMVAILRGKKPGIRFTLELITRDPLLVPCLTEQYWATLPGVPGKDLARILRLVRERAASSLPRVESLPLAEQVSREDGNVRASLDHARERLGL